MELSAEKSMKKVKEITKRRLDKYKIVKQPGKDFKCDKCVVEKENICPTCKHIPRKQYQKEEFDIFNPKIPDHKGKNPFCIPLRNRVFQTKIMKRVEKPIKMVEEEVKTVTTHIHDQFYKVIDGRPVRPSGNIKVFMNDIRNILLYRANAAYLRDKILNIDMLLSFDELNSYNECYKLYKDTCKSFQKFLEESYNTATNALKQSEELALEIEEINVVFGDLNFIYSSLQSRLIVLSDRIELLLMYRKFLDKISPVWWRIENGLDGQCVYFRQLFLDDDSEETYMAAKAKAVVAELKCVLYFKNPEELWHLFDDISLQCRRYIEINVYNDRVLKPIKQINTRIRNKLKTEMYEMEYVISNTEKHILWLEKKEILYRTKFFTILNEQFKELISSNTVMKLFSSVQDVHSKILSDIADPNDTLTDLMREIEAVFSKYMLLLDLMDLNIVKSISNEILRKDREMMKNAYMAQRVLKEWANFEKALVTSFKPTHLYARKKYVPKIKQRFVAVRSSLDKGKDDRSETSSDLFESDTWSDTIGFDVSRLPKPVKSKVKKSTHSRLTVQKKDATTSRSTTGTNRSTTSLKQKSKSTSTHKFKKGSEKSHKHKST